MRRELLIIVACLCVAACNSGKGKVARSWSTSMRELHITPVFPPREDVQPGDVYLSPYDAADEGQESALYGYLRTATFVCSLDLRSAMENHYVQRFEFPDRPPPTRAPTPAADAASTEPGAHSDLSNENSDDEEGQGTLFRDAGRTRLPQVAFPQLNYVIRSSASARVMLSDFLHAVGFDHRKVREVEVIIASSESYGYLAREIDMHILYKGTTGGDAATGPWNNQVGGEFKLIRSGKGSVSLKRVFPRPVVVGFRYIQLYRCEDGKIIARPASSSSLESVRFDVPPLEVESLLLTAQPGISAGDLAAMMSPEGPAGLARLMRQTMPQAPLGSVGSRVRTTPALRTDGSMSWSSMAFPSGDLKTSVLGIEKRIPREVRLNQPFEYELRVTNLTDHELQDVVLIDEPSDNLQITGLSPEGQAGAHGARIWAIGDLAPRASATILATGIASREGSAATCTTVSYTPKLCVTVPVVEPKLRLTKSGPAEALLCDEIVYAFEVANTGSGTVNNVRINDRLPAGLLTVDGKPTVMFEAGTLEAGKSKTFTAKLQAERAGYFENKATATGEGGLLAESTMVATVVRQPVLWITKHCPEMQFIGRPLSYEITVTNVGDGVARDVIIEDALPSGAEFKMASDRGRADRGKVTWNIGSLDPKASKTVTLGLEPIGAGRYSSSATARAECATPVSASCSTQVSGIPAILLEVVDVEDPIQIGDDETYVITVTNQGSAPGTNIKIVCTLEENQQYVSSSGATRGTARGRQVIFEPIRSLAPKNKATYRVVVRGVSPGDVRFKVTMTSDQFTRPVEETESTNLYE
jgi:uncharacterized repeat protein (TIGR01451 family)